ncbi:hypothetical protein [Brachyspira hyodysenteriae]|uniref:hypothetical protein n=1 Tax=Brachyspira hyodysenteriae TaxID=159 RepID=UPI0034DEA878
MTNRVSLKRIRKKRKNFNGITPPKTSKKKNPESRIVKVGERQNNKVKKRR